MTVRGGGIPRRPLALTPNGRMGPPLRSFAADAHDCIMVRVLGPTGYKVVARLNRAPKAGSPLIVIATALSVPSCSKPSRYGLARAKHAARLVRRPILTASARIDLSDARVGMKKRTLRSNQETDEGKRCAALANSLTKKAPYKERPVSRSRRTGLSCQDLMAGRCGWVCGRSLAKDWAPVRAGRRVLGQSSVRARARFQTTMGRVAHRRGGK